MNAGDFDVFSLTGQSDRIPRTELPRPGDNFAVVDLQSIGVRHLPAAVYGADYLEFAIEHFRSARASELSGGVRHLHRFEQRRHG